MDGKEFDLSKGLYDSQEGHHVLPGECVNCRCTYRSLLTPGDSQTGPATPSPKEAPTAEKQESQNIQEADPLRPERVAGVVRGEPMNFEEADHERGNPNFKLAGGYETNCQSCVVAFEARLRGYNVTALPNTTPGSMLEKLSRQTNLAWIAPETGTPS